MNFEDFANFSGGSPAEPSSDARRAASAVYDHFNALKAAGFSEEQAMRILLTFLQVAGRTN